MSASTFVKGQTYSRRDIHDALGGNMQSYLPRRDGKIVCGCFKKPFNPTAPDIILVGDRPHVVREAKLFADQIEPVPIFIKQRTNHWECANVSLCLSR